ncbi:hypothetical protein M430DRAFT_150390 [Amorphotheca resinae ATCC 22711]|jgi:hypothetical protein|uniref:Uncharacterized protein n=1 Tax=Amorphotheca resinae ATCC 22711 TaxID=857342 RepID=A0A2T3BCQ6_AMORE|nr:hypothetical protein M430DRAFT_150390 [Amorphotheca resinae ATCC 22711]PSS27154.1 hypothetical protein M430DRAFT_150390 [Amorphotheca resinae ATCC 22711]
MSDVPENREKRKQNKRKPQRIHHIASAIQSQLPSHLIPSSVSKPSSSGGPGRHHHRAIPSGGSGTNIMAPAHRHQGSHIIVICAQSIARIATASVYLPYLQLSISLSLTIIIIDLLDMKQNKTETKGCRKIIS